VRGGGEYLPAMPLSPRRRALSLCDSEKHSRICSSIERRIKYARFPESNTVDAFDFDFDPARKRIRARYLAPRDTQRASSPTTDFGDLR
jgi:hypothetical protein